jgi:hypothetical protein
MNYLGLDCSSKAVHGVIINEVEEIVAKLKFHSTPKDSFDNRLFQIFDNFSVYLENELEYNDIQCSAIEAAIYIQNICYILKEFFVTQLIIEVGKNKF